MKQAIKDTQVITASATAPRHATCPECGWSVVLKRAPSGAWAYYHQADGPQCSLKPHHRQSNKGERWPAIPEYALALGMIRATILDALNGHGIDTLAALFSPLAQAGLQQLLDADDAVTWERTQIACRRLTALNDDQRRAVRHALNWGSLTQLEALIQDSNTLEAK